jgi:hypothetical protein
LETKLLNKLKKPLSKSKVSANASLLNRVKIYLGFIRSKIRDRNWSTELNISNF